MWGYDLIDLMKELKETIKIPKDLEKNCSILNLYYISTRYPDAFTSGYPSEKFSKQQTEEAIKLVSEVLTFGEDKISENRESNKKSSKNT